MRYRHYRRIIDFELNVARSLRQLVRIRQASIQRLREDTMPDALFEETCIDATGHSQNQTLAQFPDTDATRLGSPSEEELPVRLTAHSHVPVTICYLMPLGAL